METIKLILLPYLVLALFASFISDHVINFQGSSRFFRNLLISIIIVSWIGFLIILINLGMKEKWWMPILLGIGGIIISEVLKSFILGIIGETNRSAISLLGLILVPVALFIVLNRIGII